MQVQSSHIEGPLVIQPKVFGDHRGYFTESYNQKDLEKLGITAEFVQDNQSMSKKGILRGMHFQNPPYAQGKLVRVIKGKALDVIVDIRKDSPTYGQHMKVELSEENFTMLWVPPGFAHGFLTLEEDTIFAYKCTDYYVPESEGGLMWNDPDFNIDWGIDDPILSDRDTKHKPFSEFNSPFF